MFRRLTPVAKNILIINVAILLISSITRLPLNEWFGLRVIYSSEFVPYQFFTYMWLHGSVWHLFGNMIAILVFAPMLEMVWGFKRFLIFYLICGIGAGILYGVADAIEKLPLKDATEAYINNPSPEAFERFIIDNKSLINVAMGSELLDLYDENPAYEQETIVAVKSIYQGVITSGTMVGASGAVFGILFAFAYLFPNTELFLLFPPIPIKAKYLVFFYGMYELYAEFTRMPSDNVAHLAHLSGMLIAFVLLKTWKKDTQKFY